MHSIKYDNAYSSWSEALPLGNGNYGAMAFYEDNKLTIAMNHYEVYYKKLHMYSNKYKDGNKSSYNKVFGRTFEELEKMAKDMYRDPEKEPIFLYSDPLWKIFRQYGKGSGGTSHYPTGEINIVPSDCFLEPDNFCMKLDVENASVNLKLEKEKEELSISSIIAQSGDYLISEINQTKADLIKSISMKLPFRRFQDMTVEYKIMDESTFYYVGSFYPDGEDKEKYEPFKFTVIMKLIGAKGRAEVKADALNIDIYDADTTVTMITTVVTEEETKDIFEIAKERINKAVLSKLDICENHKAYWDSFWNKSAVTLPDKMVEDLWYVNLYALACSSGKGGRMYHQACGLNGLWDIIQPTRWGSSWYWDVNIQAAFSPLYTANHLEIAEVFNEALLSYTKNAEKMSKEFHGLEGYASDYPFALYLSTWGWCSQFVWSYYNYSMDKAFLKEKAYPLFKNVAKFFESYLKHDAEKDEYFVYPDISPEQGPFTRNSTITISVIRYLFKICIESNRILEEDESDLNKWSGLLEKISPYPLAISKKHGEIIKDSEWAPADLHLRHPSVLMPIYPIGEINKYSDENLKKVAENTLKYVEQNTEIGVFQFGWLSCAASRLGKGNTALRLLYEQGIDLLLRPNGLFSEETERWINFCNVTAGAIYYPNMMEATGEMIASVNEMLLQSYNGVIQVFPAVPSGEIEKELAIGMYEHEVDEKIKKYDKWNDCSFKNLLAEGAFEVSSEMKNGLTKWVKIKSLCGNKVIMRNSFMVDKLTVKLLNGEHMQTIEHVLEDNIISFLTTIGNEYLICEEIDATNNHKLCFEKSANALSDEGYPRIHEAHTHRRVFLGKNKDTEYTKMLDNFTFDYYSGNYRESRTSIYRLDFSTDLNSLKKDYVKALPRQFHMGGGIGQNFTRVSKNDMFTTYTGLGWDSDEGLSYCDRAVPDELRRDFISGSNKKSFYIELPKGRYDILIVCGDDKEPSYTEIDVDGQFHYKPEKTLKSGEYSIEILPIIQKKDGYVNITFNSCEECKWNVNFMIVNKYYRFL